MLMKSSGIIQRQSFHSDTFWAGRHLRKAADKIKDVEKQMDVLVEYGHVDDKAIERYNTVVAQSAQALEIITSFQERAARRMDLVQQLHTEEATVDLAKTIDEKLAQNNEAIFEQLKELIATAQPRQSRKAAAVA